MAPIRSLRDSDDQTIRRSNNSNKNGSQEAWQSHNRDIQIAHIPHLRDANHAKRLLVRIYKEFLPILQKRGYPVRSVSEMCCCGDGLDFLPNRRGKKKRIMGSNVLGYNQTVFYHGTTHTIHLRLRQPSNHDVFYDYEHIAGTMSHELAHCEIAPHNAMFYKLMDNIQEQHAVFLARGIVADNQGFPINSDQAYVLGSSGGVGRTADALRHTTARAAQQRQQNQRFMPQGPQRLGGTSEFQQWLLPGEAAGVAAETRRLQDEIWCQPCEPEIIELSDDNVDDDDDSVNTAAAVKNDCDDDQKISANINVDTTTAQDEGMVDREPSPSSVVDLTGDDNKEADDIARNSVWSCTMCTFVNSDVVLACSVCGAPLANETYSMQVAQYVDNRERNRIDAASKRLALRLLCEEVQTALLDFGV